MKYALIGCGRVSPNHIRAAIAAGKQMLIEKPIALSMADARRICKAA